MDLAVPVHEHVAMVQISQRDTVIVDPAYQRQEAVEEEIVERALALPRERLGIDVFERERERTEPPVEPRDPGNALGGPVDAALATDQPASQEMADHEPAGRVVLDGDIQTVDAVNEEVGLGAVTARDMQDRRLGA